MPTTFNNRRSIGSGTSYDYEYERSLIHKKTTETISVSVIEQPYADPPGTKHTKSPLQPRSSAESTYTSLDGKIYSSHSSKSTSPSPQVVDHREKDNGIRVQSTRLEDDAGSSTSSEQRNSQERHNPFISLEEEWNMERESLAALPPVLCLKVPAKAHLRLEQEQKRVRVLSGPVPKSSYEELEQEERVVIVSGAQSAAVAKAVDNIQIMEQDRIIPSESIEIFREVTPKPVIFPTTQLPLKERLVDENGSLRARARRKILAHKHSMQAFQVTSNGFCIFATWFWPRYYYILLPLITATVALNVAMIGSVVIRALWNKFRPETTIQATSPETMVLLIPCYNETKEELFRSLESLVAQKKIEDHKQTIVIVCDGKVRGPGMDKTTADYLLEDILTDRVERKRISGAYTAWDQQPMDVVIQRGKYQGVPYYCIIKQQNQGKRDSLILIRSFLYNFNRRTESPSTIFSPEFFNALCSFMIDDGDMDNCVHLIGMDADTVFDDDCIYELLQESRYPHTVGVCGYVAVDWKDSNWNPWRLYQSTEYTIAQCLRRLHQSMVTHKVSCLPGCCQLLKICEETCGDHVLLELFGYCPVETDSLLKQIRATASEDRNHVCHMLCARPKSQTRQALKAKAYTDVPNTWSVFLSQRRRWTLGATSNDLLLAFSRGVNWFERILALVNVITWTLNPFIIASLVSFIFAIIGKFSQHLRYATGVHCL
jgi:chitin synthase